jgi:hypothetical protein
MDSPGMIMRLPNGGSQYLIAFMDADKNYLDSNRGFRSDCRQSRSNHIVEKPGCTTKCLKTGLSVSSIPDKQVSRCTTNGSSALSVQAGRLDTTQVVVPQ